MSITSETHHMLPRTIKMNIHDGYIKVIPGGAKDPVHVPLMWPQESKEGD